MSGWDGGVGGGRSRCRQYALEIGHTPAALCANPGAHARDPAQPKDYSPSPIYMTIFWDGIRWLRGGGANIIKG